MSDNLGAELQPVDSHRSVTHEHPIIAGKNDIAKFPQTS